jgi:hypothetical protein
MPKALATSLLTSLRIGKASLLSRCDLRLFGAVCGETARRLAPRAAISGNASCSACSSKLQ